jgi:heptosyltransferase III
VTPLPREAIRRILLCRPNHRLGNLLFMTPALAEMAVCFPRATVDILAQGQGVHALFSGFGNLGKVFELPRNGFHKPTHYLRAIRSLWRERYDLVVDPEFRSRSARFIANRCRTIYRLGFSPSGDAAPLTHAFPPPGPTVHMARRPIYLLRRAVDEAHATTDEPYPELDVRLSAAERVWGLRTVADTLGPLRATRGPVITLFANATGAKRLPSAWWQQLTRRLRELDPHAAFLEILPPDAAARSELNLPSYQSDDLRRVAAVLSSTTLFVSADCGVLHLACASGIPRVIGLFSVSDERLYGPVGNGRSSIVARDRAPADVARSIHEVLDAGRAPARQDRPRQLRGS